jgi:hypothetical protein
LCMRGVEVCGMRLSKYSATRFGGLTQTNK